MGKVRTEGRGPKWNDKGEKRIQNTTTDYEVRERGEDP